MAKRIAVYSGSFDLITNGHMWMIAQGSLLFDELFVVVAPNADKQPMFRLSERTSLLMVLTSELVNVSVRELANAYLANYARELGAQYLLRGVRDEGDFTYEQRLLKVNRMLAPELTTVLLTPPDNLVTVSSSIVKAQIGPAGWEKVVRAQVPEVIFLRLLEKMEERKQ